jgi:SAM-dependent methyltransferase
LNIFKLFYGAAVGLLSRFRAYEGRTGKYLSHFKRYVDDARVIVDVGCGSGAFSKALACEKRLVIALDIEKRLLKEIEGSFIERMCADAHNSLSVMARWTASSPSRFLSMLKIPGEVWKSFTEC